MLLDERLRKLVGGEEAANQIKLESVGVMKKMVGVLGGAVNV